MHRGVQAFTIFSLEQKILCLDLSKGDASKCPLATQSKYQKPRHTLSALSPQGQGATVVYQQLAHETLLILDLGEGVSSLHMYNRDNQKCRVI